LNHRIYHIGLGRAVRFGDAVAEVQRKFPQAAINVGPGLNFAHLEKDPNYCVLDIGTATEDLGYRPRYDLASGLDDYAETLDRYVAAGLAKPAPCSAAART
jgi:nucleoside-diphosphate-sugar epimerase